MKIRVLFADDDPDVIRDIMRAARSRRDWKTYFASGCEEALGILAENKIDIVVLDLRMPGMDGLELLKTMHARHPHIIRMVLSGYADQDAILRSTTLAHQFFAKPCSPEVLMTAIEDSWLLRDLIVNARLRDLIAGIADLPSLPSAYMKLMEYIQNTDASIKKIGDMISEDITMTAQLLHVVNSSFFSLPRKVVDPGRAVSLLGIENLKAFLLYAHIFSMFETPKKLKPHIDDLWRHSIAVSRLAREIAIAESADRATVENALAIGILHDVGKLVLMQITGQNHDDSVDEYTLFGATHSEVGAYLLGIWAMPASIVEGVVWHHHPVLSGAEEFTALAAVHAADALVSNSATDCSEIPGLSYSYLKAINKAARLPKWIELNEAMQECGSLPVR